MTALFSTSRVDEEIKQRLESIYSLNKNWMSNEQFNWFIKYKLYRENIGDVQFDSNFILENISNITKKKVLDVGCGPGDIVISLARKNIDIVGIDMSQEDIEVAKLKLSKYNLDRDLCHVQDGSCLPYQDESFDVVTCIEVLEHTGKYYMTVLKEIFRVLKPKGILYMTIPNKLCPYDTHLYAWIPHWLPKWIRVPYLNVLRGDKAKMENYLLDYNFFTPREIENILKPFYSKVDINRRYLNFKFNTIQNDSGKDIRSLVKNIVKKTSRMKILNDLLIKSLTTFYFFQSIKILAEKE